ncbi:ribonuclease E inhibitor RraA/Dimethylmenaquinone methyltransferase [Coprinopsis sp. MPI-PUGE-AT-0042]|nr:ribonuclease E inhibitor RraA/Dimethylmenaquinone methyltransferase [Coprinopsis sp. MPI-PUGE-AT-0042]
MAARTTSALSEFSTCEVSDTLIKLKVPHGGYLPDVKMISSGKICSPAYTVRMVMSSDSTSPKFQGGHFVDGIAKGHVVVIDAPAEAKNAVWGGLMSAGALSRGATGAVISGNTRDLAEHRSLNFPVFARGHSTLGQSPFTRMSEVNVPVTIEPQYPSGSVQGSFPALTIQPGDWVVADEDGVVCVPKELEDQVVEMAARGRAIDELCMQDIRGGRGISETFKDRRGAK